MYLCKQISVIMLHFFKKKPITGYPRSFAKRLTWRIMLRMIIIMILPVYLLFQLTYGIVTTGGLEIADRLLSGEIEEIRRITSDLYTATTNTAPFVEENLDKPDRMYDIINRMLKLNPYMRSCSIYFVEGYYPQKGRLFAPYAQRRDSIIMESQNACDQGNDYVNAEWFKEAISSESGYWAKPFLDNDSAQSPLVSYLMPIRDKKQRTVAVIGVDLSLEWLNEKIQFMKTSSRNDTEEWSAEYQGYYYMTDSAGTFLVHPDAKRLVRKSVQPSVTKNSYFAFNLFGKNEMVVDGENVLVCSQDVKYTNWTMSIVIPTIYFDFFGYSIAGIAIASILIGLLVVYFFGRRSVKKAVKPLSQLATSANEVAK